MVPRHPRRRRREAEAVDPVIRQALTEDWPLSRLDSTLRAILRAGVYELTEARDVPVAVIVTEYVDIAKAFYEDEEPKLVNAVLDRVSRRVRGEGRGRDAAVSEATVEPEARRSALILAAAQAIVGSAAPICISIGALAGHHLLGADKSLATAPVTGFNLGVALGALPAAAVIRALGQRGGFMTGTLVTGTAGRLAPWRCSAAISGCLRWR